MQKLLKEILMIILGLSALKSTGSQPFGNEWINYNQQYFTISIVENGIYRIDYGILTNAGIPLGTFDPRSFQIFHNGQEQPIIVRNEQSGVFQPGDYIEFYAKKNDGFLDRYFYQNPEDQPNPNYSLINDTAKYYLTWNNLLANKRYAVEQDDNFAGYTAAPFIWHTSRQDYTSHYFAGETNNYGVTDPEYTRAEGWFDSAFNKGQSRTKTIPSAEIHTAGPNAQIEFAVVGASNFRPLSPNHHLQIQFANVFIDTLYTGYKLLRFNYNNISPSELSPTGTQFVFSAIDDLETDADRNTISYIQIRYPRTFNLSGFDDINFELPSSSGDKTFVRFANYAAGTDEAVWIYDFTNNKKVRAFLQGGEYRALLSSPTTMRNCLLTKESRFKQVESISAVNDDPTYFARFRDFNAVTHVDSDYLIITHNSLMTGAEDYRLYRESTGYKVLLVDVDELYHQFGYGIGKHPIALRNFARYTIDAYQEPPRNLFLLGKSLNAINYRKNATHYASTLVPSFGFPPSDILITAGISGGLYEPAIATGRLAARNNNHIQIYLDKVIQYENENQSPKEWMKNVLHFGGGSSISEQNLLANYLRGYQNLIEDTLFGAYVRTFLKSSTEPIQINQSDSLKDIINNGVSLMTFFGHAAGIGFDISIDHPSEYNNFGKYPFLLANSCFSGDIFGTGVSSSEEFVIIDGKGVIGYLASTSASGAFELNRYSERFIKNISSDFYGSSVGESIKNTISEIQSNNIYIKNACLLNTLHGDPAIVINSHEKPDYKITPQRIFTTPQNVTTEVDSFYVHVAATNIGRAINDSIVVELSRTFPDGTTHTEVQKVSAPYYIDTLNFKLPVNREIAVGLNQFKVTLDLYNEVDEFTTDNNTAIANILITSSDIIPVFPYRYAIYPSSDITLKASTGNPFMDEKDYIFQIDTSENFENPNEEVINNKGGVVTWKPQISYSDSTVYYWRVALQTENKEDIVWRESSFQYINGVEGWAQADFSQFKNNKYVFVAINEDEQKWEFVNSVNVIDAQTGYYPIVSWNDVYTRMNNVIISESTCLGASGHGMIFMVFDPVSGEPWKTYNQGNNTGEYGNLHCWETAPRYTFSFRSTDEYWRGIMKDFIDDVIPQGHYVLVQTYRNHNSENYPEELYQAFESLGSAYIRNLENSIPYMLFNTKGSVIGSANEVIGSTISSVIQLTDSITTNWNQGYILSERIGPAKNWQSVHFRHESYELPDTDSVWYNILGVRHNGDIDTLYKNIPSEVNDIILDNPVIDAEQYPYLRLMINMMDEENRTPAQMKWWQVIYDPVPETALNPSLHYVFDSESLPEGKDLMFSTAIQNISDYDMDSLLVRYYVMDEGRNIHPIEYARQGPHPAGDVLTDTVVFNTKDFAGHNTFWIEVNPLNDQPEQYHFNNIGVIPFTVERDNSNPLLDVTFDGVRIMDGDIVSATPNIVINLYDENPYLLLNDTSLVKVYLQKPGSQDAKRLYYYQKGVEVMRFYPATEAENKCEIEFNPEFSVDGTYKLLVQAIDKSKNESGNEDLSINFEIITRSTITEVLNWPNPFSTHTHFVFTLTGSELPTFFKIQILTITGRVVREIDMSELGPIRIGRNITQYAWNGTDQYGDRLANGVYLYRVISNIDEKAIEMNHTSAQKYFHKGFGKMYLIR